MRQRTRKFLAGLLSLGLLLQAASPLSALAAGTGADPAELTITISETDYGFDQSANQTLKAGSTNVTVRYDSSAQRYVVAGTFGDNMVIAGTQSNGQYPNIKFDIQSKGPGKSIKPQNLNDVEITSTTGVTIDNSSRVYGDLDVNANGYIWIGGTTDGKVTITSTSSRSIYMQPFYNTEGYVAESMVVNAPNSEQFRIIGYHEYNKPLTKNGITVTAKSVILDARYNKQVGKVTFHAPDSGSYVAYTDVEKTNSIALPNNTELTGEYLVIEEGTPATPTLSITVDKGGPTQQTVTLTGKSDGAVDMTGDALNLTATYEPTTGTYTISSTLRSSAVITGTAAGGQKPSLVLTSKQPTLDVSGVKDFSIDAFEMAINGSATIDCDGAVRIASSGSNALSGTLTITNAGDVTLKSKKQTLAGGSIQCSGKVEIISGSSVGFNDLTIKTSDKVSITGYVVDALLQRNCLLDVTASGLTLNNTMGGIGRVKFTPSDGGEYAAFTDAEELENLPNGEVISGSSLSIQPKAASEEPADTAGSTADAGGALAAVMVGGAAVWGGYQAATRVILHKLLPEGAAIPANRGQLALLVWNAAGRPEPAAAPAFTDVADADTAKAAQWCAEQGYLDAKTESTFKPDGLVTKVKVIKVWNAAFPKN